MLLLLVAVLVLAASVPLFGGRLARLADLRFRTVWLIWAAVAAQVMLFFVLPQGAEGLRAWGYVASYAAGVAFLVVNRHVPGVGVVVVGAALNLAAIVSNGGQMPAAPGALETAGLVADPARFTNSVAAPDAVLWFLGDVFAVGGPSWLANVFSPGDVLVALGVAYGVHRACGSRPAVAVGRVAQDVGDRFRDRSRKSRTVTR